MLIGIPIAIPYFLARKITTEEHYEDLTIHLSSASLRALCDQISGLVIVCLMSGAIPA